MSVSYRIYPDHGLVHVRYAGEARIRDTMEAFGQYLKDPGFAPGQKHLVDLTELTGYERDYPGLFALQARKAEAFRTGRQSLMVYLAPTPLSRSLAELAIRSWDGLNLVVPRVQETEADALAILGLRERSLDELARRPA